MAKPYYGNAYCSCCATRVQSRKQASEWFKIMDRFRDFVGRGDAPVQPFLCPKCRNGIAEIAVAAYEGMCRLTAAQLRSGNG